MAAANGYSNAEVKAGVFLTICLALFVGMLFFFGKVSRIWRARQEINVVFTSVTSLRPDAPVRYNGVEVGRVKDIRILHLDKQSLGKLPSIGVKDLENLPLTEKEQKTLRAMASSEPLSATEFQNNVEKWLQRRTMIQLVLDVQEGDKDRYREDDQVRITTTLMGDTAVEITAGSGATIEAQRLMLGHSGDFFSNLARSVEQVKEILSSVGDVVGPDERDSVRKALRRFDTISERIEKIVKLADDRLPATWGKVDDLADTARQNFTRIGDTVAGVQPQVAHTLGLADDAIKDVQDRVGKLADEARSTVVEVKGDVKPIFADLQSITSRSKDDLPVMIRNARDLAARLQESAGKVDAVISTGNKLLADCYLDLRRLVWAFRLGAENFEEATNLLKRKPWLIYNAAKENDVYNNAQKTARDLDIATRRFGELTTEMQAIRRTMDPARTPKDDLDRIDFAINELSVLCNTLKFAGDVTKREVLPPFDRKKGGFIPIEEQFDPRALRKKSEENQ